MNRCPITYEPCLHQKYSKKGLELLSKKLEDLQDFPLTAKEQIEKALELSTKLSIQGVQPKFSVKLAIKEQNFKVVERGGTYIIKPPHQVYEELPQNEDLTMKMASAVGLEVPLHGMIYNIDGTLSYFIKRFDRISRGSKLAVEDFSQLLGYSRDTKYESSMEQVIQVIDKFCSFPTLEKLKLFRLVLFNFLVGNEDMHLKNYSLIRYGDITELSPCYDLLNSTIVLKTSEEIALPIRGKKSKFKRADLIDYFGQERLGLPQVVIQKEMMNFQRVIHKWHELIEHSFLSEDMKEKYRELLKKRQGRIWI